MPWLSGSHNNSGGSATDRHKVVQDVIVRCLGPPPTNHYTTSVASDRRFSTLLLEHGETAGPDWAVVVYSTAAPLPRGDSAGGGTTSASSSSSSSGAHHSQIHWAQRTPPKRNASQPQQRFRTPTQSSNTTTLDPLDQYPTLRWTKIAGRLHLCSRSLVFEPSERSRPIVRCPFQKLVGMPQTAENNASTVQCYVRQHVLVKANNVVGPYLTVPHAARFSFTFLHSPPAEFLQSCPPLIEAATAPRSARNKGPPPTPPRSLVGGGTTEPSPAALDVRSPTLATLSCQILTPLQSTAGTLVVTADRLYFTSHVSAPSAPHTTWWLSHVTATARRYHGLRDAALEIYWKKSTTATSSRPSSTLLALSGRHDREVLWRYLPPTAPCVTDRAFVVDVARAWQAGVLSNYEYLLAVNAAGGRTFHDLSRYPVFPWVVADYTSTKLHFDNPTTYRDLTKPVGALNEERLQYFRTRLEGMQDMEEKFLYGTHYSAPGYVLYYLVRSMPEHMLCLQNGKFDAPDRMFHSIAHTYQCVLRNHADVKEVIPEFYNANADFDFLINARGLSLGATQNGERVDDVLLPPWARSGRDFIKKNRKALESSYVTTHLPAWIDLIFGSKSRGEAALEANNLFHQMAYLGPRDLADMPTEDERFTAELQATEFGIVPDQLFSEDHPSKTENEDFNEAFISEDVGRASSKEDLGGREAWELLENPVTVIPRASDDLVTPVSDFSVDAPSKSLSPPAASVSGSASFVKDHAATGASGKMPLRGSGQVGESSDVRTGSSFGEMNQPPSTDVPVDGAASTTSSPKEQNVLDSTKSMEWDMSVVERRKIHNDAVSGCILWLDPKTSEKSILVSTSLDGGLSVHKVTLDAAPAVVEQDKGTFTSTFAKFSYSTIMSRAQGISSQSKLTEFRTHSSRDPLASLVLASDGADGHVAFAGGHDDVVLAYGINSACAVASVYSHRDAVTGLDLICRTPLDRECVLWPEASTHILVSGSWDATVKVWSAVVATGEAVTIQREPLAELFDADSGIVCTSSVIVPTGGIVIAAGCADGSFCVWELHNDGVQVVLHNEVAKRGSGPCSVVQWIAEGGSLHLFAAFSTGKVATYTLMDGRLHRVSAVSVGVAILSMKYSNGVLLVGCADGGLRLIPVRPGSSFGKKPTLWTAVNNKNAPGISCISVTYMNSRCMCCTGGEDGSVLVFELKRV